MLYFACVTRYDKFFEKHEEFIPHVLAVFFSESGFLSSNPTVRGRACYLFFQFCSKVCVSEPKVVAERLSWLLLLVPMRTCSLVVSHHARLFAA
jgi:hypothetical protein